MKHKGLGLLLIISLILSGCGPLSADILLGNQESAVETMVAATMAFLTLTPPVTFTPQPSPTITETPPNTPKPTITDFPTATFVPTVTPFVLPTITPFTSGTGTAAAQSTSGAPIQGSGEYACQLIKTDPAGLTKIDGKTKFNAVWKVLNAGSLAWSNEGVELVFLSGKRSLHDIPNETLIERDVYPGETYNVKVNMLAPNLDGLYESNWGLRKGNNVFCEFGIRFIVPPK